MLNRCLLLLFFALVIQVLPARDMRACFKEAPVDVFPLLTHNNRLDMLDFWDSKMDAVVKNVYGDSVQLSELRENYMRLESSSVSEMELMLLPAMKDTLLCMVKTYRLLEPESELSFFHSATWTPISEKENLIVLPQWTDFLVLPEKISKEELRRVYSKLSYAAMQASLDADELAIRFTLNVDGGFLDRREELAPLIKKTVVMKWNGRKFVLQ